MKTCIKCGKIMEDGAVICTGCGTPFKASTNRKLDVVKPIGYIGRYLITLIPFVGPIVFFALLFVWSSDKTKEESFRNWAKSQLLWMLIFFCLFILLFVFVLILGFSLNDIISEMVYY